LGESGGHFMNRLCHIDTHMQEGAFDEAVRGVDVIEHTASPVHYESDHPDGVSCFSIRISSTHAY
jgi:hypothetical protein